jgi:hypothetical protein
VGHSVAEMRPDTPPTVSQNPSTVRRPAVRSSALSFANHTSSDSGRDYRVASTTSCAPAAAIHYHTDGTVVWYHGADGRMVHEVDAESPSTSGTSND